MPSFTKLASSTSLKNVRSLFLGRRDSSSSDGAIDHGTQTDPPRRSISTSSPRSPFRTMSTTLRSLSKGSRASTPATPAPRGHARIFLDAAPHIDTITTDASARARQAAARTPYQGPPVVLPLDSPDALAALDTAARQTLMYADEVLYAPGGGGAPQWAGDELAVLARGFLTAGAGWEVRYRCEARPWVVFRLEGEAGRRAFWEWLCAEWNRAVECALSTAPAEGGRDDEEAGEKESGAGEVENGDEESRENEDREREKDSRREARRVGEDVDEDWVCFSKKKGVMRIDLTASLVYLDHTATESVLGKGSPVEISPLKDLVAMNAAKEDQHDNE